jgi:hypothetical protein
MFRAQEDEGTAPLNGEWPEYTKQYCTNNKFEQTSTGCINVVHFRRKPAGPGYAIIPSAAMPGNTLRINATQPR